MIHNVFCFTEQLQLFIIYVKYIIYDGLDIYIYM